jgi:hypothetical protein
MTTCRVEASHELPAAAGESPSIAVVIHITVDHPAAEADDVDEFTSPDDRRWRPVTGTHDGELDAQPSAFTDPDVGTTRHLAEVDLTHEPAAVTRTRRPGSSRRLSTSRSRSGWCTLTVVAVAAVIGAAAWISHLSANQTAALAATAGQPVDDHPTGLSGPDAATPAATSRCGWARFDLADSGVPGAGTGAVHRHAGTHAIVAAPGPHTQTLYYRDCPGASRTYRWRASTG